MTDITWHEVKGDEVWEDEQEYLVRWKGYHIVLFWSQKNHHFMSELGPPFEYDLVWITHYAKIGEVK